MISKASKRQIGIIHAILGKIGKANDKEYKRNLVGQYSNGRETSTKELSFAEARAMIEDLQKAAGASPKEIAASRMRRKIFAIAHNIGMELPNGKIDMAAVDGFCIEKGHGKKKLINYTNEELPKLIYQFQELEKSHVKKVVTQLRKS